MKLLTGKINSLPKWAIDEIKVLLMKLNECQDEIKRLNSNPESNTIVGTISSFRDDERKYLKNNQPITFVLNGGDIIAKIENDYLNIHYSNDGVGKELFIRPKVSNVIQIHVK